MFTGAEAFRNPLQKYIFNIRASYNEEIEEVMRYFVDNKDLKRIAIFYQNDAFGLAGRDGARLALEKRGLKAVAEATYERNTENVEVGAGTLAASQLDAIIMIGTYAPLAKFVRLVKEETLDEEIYFHTVSFVGSEAFAEELVKKRGIVHDAETADEHEAHTDTENIFVTQVVPPPYYDDIFDGLYRNREVLQKYYPEAEATFGGLEGYISMRVLLDAIENTGRELTREKLMDTLENFRQRDISIGSTVSFTPEDHQALRKVFLTTIVDGEYLVVPVR